MADVKLSDGREIIIDLSKMTLKEWRECMGEDQKRSDEVIAKITGLKVKEIGELLYDDSRRLFTAILKKAREPLADPT